MNVIGSTRGERIMEEDNRPQPPELLVPHEIVFYAFRYSLGRSTFAGQIVQDMLREVWTLLPLYDREQIIKEIKEAVELGKAGMEIDELDWLAFVSWAHIEDVYNG